MKCAEQITHQLRIGVLIELVITVVAGVATVVSLASISSQSALIGASFNICAGLAITVVAVMTW